VYPTHLILTLSRMMGILQVFGEISVLCSMSKFFPNSASYKEMCFQDIYTENPNPDVYISDKELERKDLNPGNNWLEFQIFYTNESEKSTPMLSLPELKSCSSNNGHLCFQDQRNRLFCNRSSTTTQPK
jgi:hypothetical protein